MGSLFSIFGHKRYTVFLNISFLIVGCTLLVMQFDSADLHVLDSYNYHKDSSQQDCEDFLSLDGYQARCIYLKSNSQCVSEGYINYLYLFYCYFGRFPLLGHCLLFLWLLILFYLLGDTASEYFCSSLEALSRLLKLSPTIAGVTLLSLGNGAPDVFSSLVSFLGSGTSDVGLNTVLGGAFFVTCVVVGTISILVRQNGVRVDKVAFLRDICFLFIVLAILLVILIIGKINLWGALCFWSMYIVYVMIVYITGVWWKSGGRDSERDASSSWGNDLSIPVLSNRETIEEANVEEVDFQGVNEAEARACCPCFRMPAPCRMFLCLLEMPLYLPRRLTIPMVSEKRWSKSIAVMSVFLAPLLLSTLWILQYESAKLSTILLVYGLGALCGIAFGVLAFVTTDKSSPPRKYRFIWLAGGFVMSVTWSYVIAQELVGLLVSFGYIIGISSSILAFTVLAWGNSLGDLIADSTMALKGGSEGAQIAISACYAGPIFNILFGLGLSFICSSWSEYPSSITISVDPYLLETLGLLAAGLLWALVVLPWRNSKLDGVLGGGLLAIYLMSVSLRLIQTLGFSQYYYKHM